MNKGLRTRSLLQFTLFVFPLLPILVFGLKPDLHDAWIHRLWSDEFARALVETRGYPRWLSGMNGGLGSPAMFYYPPLPYLIPTLWKVLFGFGDGSSPMALAVGCFSAFTVAAGGMYRFLRNLFGHRAALVGAFVYVLSPYYLGIDLYGRGAYAETWAFSWMPLVLLGIDKLKVGDVWGLLVVAASYGALIISHLPTTLVFSPIAAVYSFIPNTNTFGIPTILRLRSLSLTGVGLLIGVGISAPYLFPAMLMQGHVNIDFLTTPEILKYNNQYLFGSFLVNRIERGDNFAFWLHFAYFITFAIGVTAYGTTKGLENRQHYVQKFFLGMLVVSAFLIVPLSHSIWSILPQLQMIQFPWRILSLLTLATSALVAYSVESGKLVRSMFLRIYVCAVSGLVFLLPTGALMTEFVSAAIRGDTRDTTLRMGVPEYRPKWSPHELHGLVTTLGSSARTSKVGVVAKARRSGDEYVAVRYDPTNAVLRIDKWQSRELALYAKSDGGIECVLSQLYYPGWSANIESRPLPLSPSPDGLLAVRIPPGNHNVRIELSSSAPEKWGNRIGIVSGIVFGGIVVFFCAGKNQHHHPKAPSTQTKKG